jgi:sugar phosphate isomerase/epimerase
MGILWGKMVADLSLVQRAASDGFDFIQPVKELSSSLAENQAVHKQARVLSEELPFRACAVPLPPGVRVTQKGFNIYVWMEHLKSAMQRLAELGCRKLIWSDGGARLLPVEGATAWSEEQALQFLYMLCGAAADFDISVLVEPLGPRRTNFLNTMRDSAGFLSRVGKQNLACAISLRELERIGLSLSALGDYRQLIDHVHLDNPGSYEGEPVCPRPTDGYDYRPFVEALRGAGYSSDISLPADADAEGVAYCRGLWAR